MATEFHNLPDDTQTLWRAIQEDVVEVHAQWQFHKELFGQSAERLAVLNGQAPSACSLIQDLLLDSVLLALSRLKDQAEDRKKNKNGTLERLVVDIKAYVPPSTAQSLDIALKNYRTKCLVFDRHRNKRVAHTDYVVRLGSQDPLTFFPYADDYESALRALREFMWIAEMHLDGQGTAYDMDRISDFGTQLMQVFNKAEVLDDLRNEHIVPMETIIGKLRQKP